VRPRHVRRLAQRVRDNRDQAGYSHAEWVALSRNERKQITQQVRSCLVCQGPSDSDECDSCHNNHDTRITRLTDI
jgi:recombinational DNA repair protein RecR